MKYISHFTLTLIKKRWGITIFYGYNIAILSVISKNQERLYFNQLQRNYRAE